MANVNPYKYWESSTIAEWRRSDEYHNSFLIPEDKVLAGVRKNNVDKGLPDIAVSVAQGKLLHLYVRSIAAKRVLEVGTLGGYSTIWLARGLAADGKLISLELSSHHAEARITNIARENVHAAGLSDKVEIIVGPAGESLKNLNTTFDLIFIDADKVENVIYYNEAKRLVRKGGVIIIDNVVWGASVAFPEFSDPSIEGIRNLLKAMKDDPDVDATTIATVGERGFDGFIYAVRN